ncbi:MAG: hypothetical protein AB7J35_17050 [Dehalococcoidia bacterium]
MTTEWWGCASNWCWFGPVTSYVNIAAIGHQYDSAGIRRSADAGANQWNSAGLTLTYYNTPYTWSPPLLSVDAYGTAYIHTTHCKTNACGFSTTYENVGNTLGAVIPYQHSYSRMEQLPIRKAAAHIWVLVKGDPKNERIALS